MGAKMQRMVGVPIPRTCYALKPGRQHETHVSRVVDVILDETLEKACIA